MSVSSFRGELPEHPDMKMFNVDRCEDDQVIKFRMSYNAHSGKKILTESEVVMYKIVEALKVKHPSTFLDGNILCRPKIARPTEMTPLTDAKQKKKKKKKNGVVHIKKGNQKKRDGSSNGRRGKKEGKKEDSGISIPLTQKNDTPVVDKLDGKQEKSASSGSRSTATKKRKRKGKGKGKGSKSAALSVPVVKDIPADVVLDAEKEIIGKKRKRDAVILESDGSSTTHEGDRGAMCTKRRRIVVKDVLGIDIPAERLDSQIKDLCDKNDGNLASVVSDLFQLARAGLL